MSVLVLLLSSEGVVSSHVERARSPKDREFLQETDTKTVPSRSLPGQE